ncbi:MAG: hypothetical protein QOG17_736 [Gammaproteobacteria bacterium]|nr:hypothetical protein [Gammaproteobacteria bacterium]
MESLDQRRVMVIFRSLAAKKQKPIRASIASILTAINAAMVADFFSQDQVHSFVRARMGIIPSFPPPEIAFDPEAVQAMSTAFDEICAALHLPACARCEREHVAARVIELARCGLTEPRALRERVLWEAGLAGPR